MFSVNNIRLHHAEEEIRKQSWVFDCETSLALTSLVVKLI